MMQKLAGKSCLKLGFAIWESENSHQPAKISTCFRPGKDKAVKEEGWLYDVIGIGAWQTVYAIFHQFFKDITNWNSFNRNFRVSQIFFLKLFNSL